MEPITRLGCACGQVQVTLHQAPLIATECHCTSCREASLRMAMLPGATTVAAANGGTPFVLYRKDRVEFTSGQERLSAFVLGPERSTRRVIATCCNMPIFLEFKGGHWLSLYSALWPEGLAPQPELRTMTGDRPAGAPLDDAIPAGGWETTKFYGRLLTAWIGMGFRSPEVDLGGRTIVMPERSGE